ncbi:MAG: hypothetical protein IJ493_13745 [Clostridia bacterium]|nr:hypothetical protein [Clostridia bacterium]
MKKNTAAKKYFSIYIGVVLGVVLLLFATIVIVEIQTRLQPDNQVLYIAPEETESTETGLMKIYASETYWNEDKTIESRRFVEMKIGEVFSVGYLREPREYNKFPPDEFDDVFAYYHGAYIYREKFLPSVEIMHIEADAEIEIISSSGNVYPSQRVRYEMTVESPAFADTSPNPGIPDDDELGTGEWTAEAKNNYYSETLSSVYPQITDEWGKARRHIHQWAYLISAYDLTNPEKLIAQAEVKMTYCSAWGRDDHWGTDTELYKVLHDFGLSKNPDSYGYTTAELVDYWELEEW